MNKIPNDLPGVGGTEKQEPSRVDLRPRLTALAFASPRHICLTLLAGQIRGGVQLPYVPQTDDEIIVLPGRVQDETRVMRGGRFIGLLVADRRGPQLWEPEELIGTPLDQALAVATSTYTLINAATGKPTAPQRVHYKCRPVDATDPGLNFVIEHQIFLEFAEELDQGAKYQLTFASQLCEEEARDFSYCPDLVKSPAVHASQIGHHPDDHPKRAFLSLWMGGSHVEYDVPEFYVWNMATGERVFEGVGTRAEGMEAIPLGPKDSLTVGAQVWHLDYSSVDAPGTYVVSVEGVGASFPFRIGRDVWADAFQVSMRGLFHHRSGIEVGPPFTDYRRPRPYHPADGTLVFHSNCSLFESGNGLNAYTTDKGNFGNLVKGRTNRVVGDAWGGYFDACDWDRRIQHLYATRLGLELFFMRQQYFKTLNLNLPETGNGIPDLLNEGCWNLDFYRRLQSESGAVRGGIEAAEHPLSGQCSWQETLEVMAYAPDFWSSHLYAATAAMMSIALDGINSELKEVYKDSSLRAMQWAERDYQSKASEKDCWSARAVSETTKARNLALIWTMRLTHSRESGDFIDRPALRQDVHAGFAYTQLPDAVSDPSLKAECKTAIISTAESCLQSINSNAYNLSYHERACYAGPYNTFYSVPGCMPLILAHHLTGDRRFFQGALVSANFSSGANPLDMIYTTGAGVNGPRAVLHHDSRRTGQACPPGITVYGNYNLAPHGGEGAVLKVREAHAIQPDVEFWPSVEAYLDIYLFPSQNEYTIMQTIGPTAYIWGYFAAR